MIRFKALIKKYDANGEKTCWTYIEIPQKVADKINPGSRKSYRVKGKLDKLEIESMALVPIGGGDFILPLKKEIRKQLRKDKGAELVASLELDANPDPFPLPDDFSDCLNDEPASLVQWKKLPKSHQNYFIKWIDSAKTDATRVKRIAQSVNALSYGMQYGEMLRALKKEEGER
ncbi:YdeI/OmpD-associated family protein [Pollutibacter soli]|uniref:YdeI/OmpD-associated family protein n=1 Tax=Pollutibacter soli TaxID=3034157 RepID=UPI003013544B